MALVFKQYISVMVGDGRANGWIGYDDAGAGPWPLTRVRYENTSTAQGGGQKLHYALYSPASDLDQGLAPRAEGDVPPGTPLTTRNVQGLGLSLVSGRYGSVVADGWALTTSTG